MNQLKMVGCLSQLHHNVDQTHLVLASFGQEVIVLGEDHLVKILLSLGHLYSENLFNLWWQ